MADHHINHMRPVGDDEAQRYANEQDSQEDEEEQQTEEEEMEEDEETEEVELQNEEYIQVVESPWISQDVVEISLENGEGEKQRRDEGGGDVYSSSGSQGSEWSRSEIDGLFCPICMETWTNSGEHHVCCLPCGHIYGFSCIKKWLQQRRTSRKCPQCNRKCTLKDIRKLFASRVTAVDEESQKRIRFLEAKCASLEKENADLCKKEAESRKSTMELQLRVNQLLDRATQLEGSSEEWQCRPSGLVRASWHSSGQSASGNKSHAIFSTEGPSCNFISQEELRVDGARLFDVDASGQIILLTRKLSRDGGTYVITKMSLISPHETQDILLLPGTRPIKDLHISPSSSGLALFASMGKKLSVIRWYYSLFKDLYFKTIATPHLPQVNNYSNLVVQFVSAWKATTLSFPIICRFLLGRVHGISTILIIYMLDYRMDHYGCLTCAKLREPWNPLMGYQATQYIQYTLFCKIQPSPLALELYCLLLPLACVSGTSVVLMKGHFWFLKQRIKECVHPLHIVVAVMTLLLHTAHEWNFLMR